MNKFIKNIAVVSSAVIMLAVVAAPAPAQAQTIAELQAMIEALTAQIAALTGSSTTGGSSYTFTRDLTVGSTGTDVMELQKFLNNKGYTVSSAGAGSPGQESTYFGSLTTAALARYQAANSISPAAGYFGPITRAQVNAMGGSTTPDGDDDDDSNDDDSSDDGDLEGGAGSIEDADFVSGLNNEEVGEDAEDVEIAGLEIEADQGSDIAITAVRLDFDQSTGATADFEDYASEVSIWLDGEEVARLDADEFTDDNAFDKTISLDDGAVIKAGDTGELTVAVTGIGNLDSSDATDSWTVIFTQVRFVDAQGASVTDTATGDIGTETRTFSFESFATAADTEFKITEGDDAINDAHIIQVDTSNDTDNEPILAFNVEIEGDADVLVDDLPVGVLVATQDNIDEMISGLTLFMDGEEVGSANMSNCLEDSGCSGLGTYETFVFDDMGLTLEGGQEYEFVVKADLYPTTGTGDLTEGDTISASTTASLIELGGTYADIEDESGEDLAAGDISGTASSDPSSVYAVGILVELVGSPTAVNDDASNDLASANDTGTFKITFDVTALDGDIFIDGDVTATATPGTPFDGIGWATTTNSTNDATSTTQATLESVAGGTMSASDGDDVTTAGALAFQVEDGETRRFTLTIGAQNTEIDPGSRAMGVRLTGLGWGTSGSDDASNNVYTFDLGDFKTPVITLDNI